MEKVKAKIEQKVQTKSGVKNMTDVEINQKIHEQIFQKCQHEWQTAKVDRYVYAQCVKCSATANIDAQPSIPNYSGDIAEAFKVVEHLESLGFAWTFSNTTDFGTPSTNYWVEFWKDGKSVVFGKSLATAICLGALEVVKGEKG